MRKIKFNDISLQHKLIEQEIESAIKSVLQNGNFIKGPEVYAFENDVKKYLSVQHVISCASGTDALIIAIRSLNLAPGDEIIIPSFSFAAAAEAAALAGLIPRFADVEPETFTLSPSSVKKLINSKTKAIIPVHLFGQSCKMAEIMQIAQEHKLFVIEDFAQSFGSEFVLDGEILKTGAIGDIGCTSFFPSKNLGGIGDGGAIVTNNTLLAERARQISQHGSLNKYEHRLLGFNSRLDTIQAAVLKLKLKLVDDYIEKRQLLASVYDNYFKSINEIASPVREKFASHSFNQYTIKIDPRHRNKLKDHLLDNGIPSMIYYPAPLHTQAAFSKPEEDCPETEHLCKSCLSLPIYPELDDEQQEFIIKTVKEYFK